MYFRISDFPTLGLGTIVVLRYKMDTDFYANDMPVEGLPSCNCPSPPDLDWRPPPDPSLIFGDLLGDMEFGELRVECEVLVPSVVPMDVVPREFGQMREYVAFLISAILMMFLVLMGAALCFIYLRRSGKRGFLIKSFGDQDQKSMGRNSSEETSVMALSNSQRRSEYSMTGRTPPTATVAETKWAYNSVKPPPPLPQTTKPQHKTRLLHQASSLGLLMYGEEQPPMDGGLQYSNSDPTNDPRLISPPTQILPLGHAEHPLSGKQQPQYRLGTFSRPSAVQISKDCRLTTALLAAGNQSSVYEEIPNDFPESPSFFQKSSPSAENIPKNLQLGRSGRMPPPSTKPPPPPNMDSPSSASCSCSLGSSSLDQELDGIQITPSPKRKDRECSTVHNPRTAYDKATQSQDTNTPTTPTNTNTPSPQDTTVSDYSCECNNGGRESGYGTEGRQNSNSRQKWTSPNLGGLEKRGKLKSPNKQVWWALKLPVKPENTLRNDGDGDNEGSAGSFEYLEG